MNPMSRTLIYVGVAVVAVALAAWKGLPTPELNPDDFAGVGEEFFPEFKDPNTATGVRVVVFNDETGDVKPFEVTNVDGDWQIPSHYNYPADGQDQLTKTAASLVAIKKGVVAGESELDHVRLGVVDPLSDDKSKSKGRGERLTLTQGSDVLLDLIIGDPVPDRDGFFYVRHPDDKLTFIAELDLDLSTQFGDWIEPDLLQVDTTELRDIVIKDYSVDETSRRIVFNETLELSRPDASTPWSLEGLNGETEELNTAAMNSMIQSLDELKIIGVRPKPNGLSANLKLTGSFSSDTMTLIDLQSKGYYVAETPNGGAELFANEGDMAATLANGVSYVLRFGEVFTGDEFDIEVGSATKDDEPESAEETTGQNLKESRYLFVSVQLDPTAIGPPPEKPARPAETDDSSGADTEPEADETETENPATDDSAAAEKPDEADSKSTEPADAATAEQNAKQEYEAALEKYEADLAAYEAKLEAGQKRVDELNERFADWYYVIDAASFDKLNKGREDLVDEKATETPDSPAIPNLTPPANSPPAAETQTPTPTDNQPEMKTPSSTENRPELKAPTPTDDQPEMKTPTADKPANAPSKPDGPATEKPAGEPAADATKKPASEPEKTPPATDSPPETSAPAPASDEKPAN